MTAATRPQPFDVDGYLEAERALAERALEGVRAEARDLPRTLAEPLDYALRSPGKRLRPILCAAAYRAAGGDADADALYRLAASVELIHAYSLVHDDLPVMDDDELRRGRPTTHRVYGGAAAALAGFVMIPLAAEIAEGAAATLGLDAALGRRLVAELCAGAGAAGMVGGQWLDLAAEDAALDVRRLERVHAAKTGALISTAARMGAVAAGAGTETVDALGEYGSWLGLAFQIADDLLDVTAAAEATGKAGGRDAALGKATYPSLLGIAGARERALDSAHVAIRILIRAGLDAPPLVALARYAVERTR